MMFRVIGAVGSHQRNKDKIPPMEFITYILKTICDCSGDRAYLTLAPCWNWGLEAPCYVRC